MSPTAQAIFAFIGYVGAGLGVLYLVAAHGWDDPTDDDDYVPNI